MTTPEVTTAETATAETVTPETATAETTTAATTMEAATGGRSVLFVLTSHGELGGTGRPTGFWLAEAAHPWEVFTGAGYRVDLASPLGGRSPIDGADPTDPVQRAFLDEVDLAAAVPLAGVDPAGYDAVLYVGGHGTMWDFPGNPDIVRIGDAVHTAGGVIAAVCHGPVGLLGLSAPDGTPLLAGRAVTCFTNDEERASQLAEVIPFFLQTTLTDRGARHSHAGVYAPHVVEDGRVVTGQNPSSAKGVAEAVVRLLKG
ncbi:type 1 glutamine amidotransferase domain-containing protein [Streptomyces sp. NPDC004610]|uniref:type 1 glutamine amidotransferase domain-containing protein n=1 Tax=unclassified Streptomyces TaxID=2593676 RepID=UPI0033BA43AD